jgi:hypothetical protein
MKEFKSVYEYLNNLLFELKDRSNGHLYFNMLSESKQKEIINDLHAFDCFKNCELFISGSERSFEHTLLAYFNSKYSKDFSDMKIDLYALWQQDKDGVWLLYMSYNE